MNSYALRLLLLAVAASLAAQPASAAADSRNPALVERFRRVALPQFADARWAGATLRVWRNS